MGLLGEQQSPIEVQKIGENEGRVIRKIKKVTLMLSPMNEYKL